MLMALHYYSLALSTNYNINKDYFNVDGLGFYQAMRDTVKTKS